MHSSSSHHASEHCWKHTQTPFIGLCIHPQLLLMLARGEHIGAPPLSRSVSSAKWRCLLYCFGQQSTETCYKRPDFTYGGITCAPQLPVVYLKVSIWGHFLAELFTHFHSLCLTSLLLTSPLSSSNKLWTKIYIPGCSFGETI